MARRGPARRERLVETRGRYHLQSLGAGRQPSGGVDGHDGVVHTLIADREGLISPGELYYLPAATQCAMTEAWLLATDLDGRSFDVEVQRRLEKGLTSLQLPP